MLTDERKDEIEAFDQITSEIADLLEDHNEGKRIILPKSMRLGPYDVDIIRVNNGYLEAVTDRHGIVEYNEIDTLGNEAFQDLIDIKKTIKKELHVP